MLSFSLSNHIELNHADETDIQKASINVVYNRDDYRSLHVFN